MPIEPPSSSPGSHPPPLREVPPPKRDSAWKLFRWWHLGPLSVLLLLAAGSIALGDPRPALLALWWIGVLTIGLGVALGVVVGFGGFVVLVWRYFHPRSDDASR